MSFGVDDVRWRGWSTDRSESTPPVTSDGLGAHARATRWFPKIRSWVALGAPLALLSPLSVARFVAVLCVLLAPAAFAFGATTWTVAAVWAIVAGGVALALGHRSGLSPTESITFVTLVTMGSVAAMATGPDHGSFLVLAVVIGAVAIFDGLFLDGRQLAIAQVSTVVTLTGALAMTRGGAAAVDGAVVSLAAAFAATSTFMVTRSARRSSAIDPDTGLPNSYGMATRLTAMRGNEVIVLTVHLLGVATARDALGHRVGSELIRRAVEDLGQVLPRSVEIGRGADDDIVVLRATGRSSAGPDAAGDAAGDVADTMRRIDGALGAGRYLVGEVEISLLAHVGVVVSEPGSDAWSAVELLRCSSLAARSARDEGVAVATWSGNVNRLTADDLAVLAELRTAADRNELWVAFQPQFRAGSRLPESVEALIRWDHPTRGSIPPGRFIALAEHTGLIDRLSDWVLEQALDAQVRWRAVGIDLRVSVNVSPRSLASVDLVERIARSLAVRHLPADSLILEITETAAFDLPRAVERLAPLRERGVGVSIDDFGAGYTSLSILSRLPLDELKLDQQFVRQLFTSPANEAIARSVCELAHRLGLRVVAEGVESEPVAEKLADFGFDLLQGYHLGVPMAEDELLATVRPLPADHGGADSGADVRPARWAVRTQD